MSAWALSLQLPPRSRARPSRTSSQSSSVSKMTPSRSKTTAWTAVMSVDTAITSNREVAAQPVDEAGTDGPQLSVENLADEDRVVARLELAPDPAVEPCQRSLETRPALALVDVHAGPQSDGRDPAAREVLRD